MEFNEEPGATGGRKTRHAHSGLTVAASPCRFLSRAVTRVLPDTGPRREDLSILNDGFNCSLSGSTEAFTHNSARIPAQNRSVCYRILITSWARRVLRPSELLN
jgi:hypothetical protein